MTGTTLFLGAIVSAASCLLSMEVGGISLKDSFLLPAHAKKEVVYKQHRDVIRHIESLIRTSPDFATAERRVKSFPWPAKVLQISLTKLQRLSSANRGAAAAESAYSRTTWTNLRSVIRDGSGYGTVCTADGERDLLIVDHAQQSAGRDAVGFTIYCERSAP